MCVVCSLFSLLLCIEIQAGLTDGDPEQNRMEWNGIHEHISDMVLFDRETTNKGMETTIKYERILHMYTAFRLSLYYLCGGVS